MNTLSQIIPYLLLAAVVALIAARRSRGRRAPGTPEVTPPAPGGIVARQLMPLPGDVGLVAARELRERLRGRVFRAATLLIIAVAAAAIVIPALLGSKPDVQRVGVVGPLSTPLRAAVAADGPAAGTTVRLLPEAGRQAAAAGLRGGGIGLAVIDGRQILVDKAITPAATSVTAQLARAVSRTLGTGEALEAAGLTAAQAATIGAARPLPVTSLRPGGPSPAVVTATLVTVALGFMMLTLYNSWTLTGVIEEKSSRVVEVLLATIRPAQLLAGKLLGIGLAAFFQAGLAVVVALSLAKGVGSGLLRGSAPLTLAATLAWLLLGYAFYCWLYAAAGSMAERQDQAQSLAVPLTLPVLLGYLVAFTTATSGNPSTLADVLGYLPPTAPFVMPVLVSLGTVSWWQFALSVVISVACTIGVARAAVGVYQRAILRTGRRVRLRAPA